MKHYDLKKVLADADECWNNDERNKDGSNEPYKRAFILGWLQQSYENMYNDLPENKKYKSMDESYADTWGGDKK